MTHVHLVCTGNAARSVMAEAMLAAWAPGLVVSSSGTHVIEGRPVSVRTRLALERHGIDVRHHRSRQLYAHRLEGVDIVVGLAVEHVRWVRRTHPEWADRTATLRRLLRDLTPGVAPPGERLEALGLAAVELEASWEDVDDPAGGEQDTFDACADLLVPLVRQLGDLLGTSAPAPQALGSPAVAEPPGA